MYGKFLDLSEKNLMDKKDIQEYTSVLELCDEVI